MAGDGNKKSPASPPPRKLNVQRFAESRGPELDALHAVVTARTGNDFRARRNERRRTTAHDSLVSKRRRRHGKRRREGEGGVRDDTVPEKLPRRVRRRVELRGNPESGFVVSGDGTRRLRTHVWHAKRFTMSKLWGFYLPLGLHGRGRGSRAVLKWMKNGAVVHDASYSSAVQLEGSKESIMSVLKMVLEPSSCALEEGVSGSISSGAVYGTAMLYHVGPPASRVIAPVTYMWRPLSQQTREVDADDNNPEVLSIRPSSECSSPVHQVWVWIHAAAFTEGYDALSCACRKQRNENGLLISCLSLEGKLARLDVLGAKAAQLLQQVLQPTSCDANSLMELKGCSSTQKDRDPKVSSALENLENIAPHSVLSFTVKDPRLFARNTDHCGLDSNSAPQTESNIYSGMSERNRPMSVCLKSEGIDISSGNRDIWDFSQVNPPLEENVLCLEKHDRRMSSLFINDPKSLPASTSSEGSRCCPILLLKNSSPRQSVAGWSVVLPLSWIKVFWIAFVGKGAHAIGLREKQWIACDVGLPNFPFDFPDCKAFSSLKAMVDDASEQKANQAPPETGCFKVPALPTWNAVRDSFDRRSTPIPNAQMPTEHVASGSSKCADTDLTSNNSRGFPGIVARSSLVLSNFLNKIHVDCLPLSPRVPKGETEIQDSKIYQDQNGLKHLQLNHKLCFVRVRLHSYREGVFEEGAVVCWPFLSDISLWTSRSDHIEEGFQIPHSVVQSCFVEHSHGHWKLQVPQDPEMQKTHRWPIGFVTTGFVRGSKKPVAEAFCEAALLASLRDEQSKETTPSEQKQKEIYVLVRNLRSTAYRLALATVVLDVQGDDFEFL